MSRKGKKNRGRQPRSKNVRGLCLYFEHFQCQWLRPSAKRRMPVAECECTAHCASRTAWQNLPRQKAAQSSNTSHFPFHCGILICCATNQAPVTTLKLDLFCKDEAEPPRIYSASIKDSISGITAVVLTKNFRQASTHPPRMVGSCSHTFNRA